MSVVDFLKYWLDTHPYIFGLVVIILSCGVSSALSNLFYNKHKSDSDKEFWKN
jgi:hypothetical protein